MRKKEFSKERRCQRATSAAACSQKTGSAIYREKPLLLCSLIHKFGRKGVDDFDAFIEELKKQ